jgi:hypothetical protein
VLPESGPDVANLRKPSPGEDTRPDRLIAPSPGFEWLSVVDLNTMVNVRRLAALDLAFRLGTTAQLSFNSSSVTPFQDRQKTGERLMK